MCDLSECVTRQALSGLPPQSLDHHNKRLWSLKEEGEGEEEEEEGEGGALSVLDADLLELPREFEEGALQ